MFMYGKYHLLKNTQMWENQTWLNDWVYGENNEYSARTVAQGETQCLT